MEKSINSQDFKTLLAKINGLGFYIKISNKQELISILKEMGNYNITGLAEDKEILMTRNNSDEYYNLLKDKLENKEAYILFLTYNDGKSATTYATLHDLEYKNMLDSAVNRAEGRELNVYTFSSNSIITKSYCTCSQPSFKLVQKGFSYNSGYINYCTKCKKDEGE